MKQKFKWLLALVAMVASVNAWGADPVVLFHETFGSNGSARDWQNSYAVMTGEALVYNTATPPTLVTTPSVSGARQCKNTMGSTGSALMQTTQNNEASYIVGPLNVVDYNTLKVVYKWKASSVSKTYTTKLYYKTSSSGTFTEVTGGSGNGSTSYVDRSYNLPQASQVETLYLKITFNTSNTQAYIDEVELTGIAAPQKTTVYLTPTPATRTVNVDDIVEDLRSWFTVSPNTYDGTISYKSSNEDVFAVDEGAGYAYAAGPCNLIISAPETDNFKAANCTIPVIVEAACSNPITITKGTETNGTFTISPVGANICADDPVTVSVTDISPAEHYHFKQITATNGNVDNTNRKVTNISANTTINVEFEEDPKFDVVFKNNGQQVGETRHIYTGDPVGTLPVLTSTDAEDARSKTFVGWTESEINVWQDAAPTLITASEVINGVKTYNAVWAKGDGKYQQITSESELIAGKKYIIQNDSKVIAHNSTPALIQNESALVEVDGKLTPEDRHLWTLTGSEDDGWSFVVDNTHKLSTQGTGTDLTLTGNNTLWTILNIGETQSGYDTPEYNTDDYFWILQSDDSKDYYVEYYNSKWITYGISQDWPSTTQNGYFKIKLYAGTSLSDYITHSSSSPLASITLNTTGVKTNYFVGEEFTSDNLTATAKLEDNIEFPVEHDALTIEGPDNLSTAGEKTVTVSYTFNGATKSNTYTVNAYSVTVNSVYTDRVDDEPVTGNTYSWTPTTGALTFSTQAHYQFNGISELSGATQGGNKPNYTLSNPTANVTMTATWQRLFTLTYNGKGGSTPAAVVDKTKGFEITLATPSWTGYEFVGWYDNEGYEGEALTSPYSITSDAEIFAKWSEIMPTGITLSPNVTEITDLIYNGSSNEQKTTITATVEPSSAFITAFEWSVVEGADVVEVADDGTISAHKAGTAKVRVTSSRDANIYKEIAVTVHALPQITWLNMDGSTFTTSNGTSAGKVGSLPANKPTSCDTEKYPYFRGWSATNFGKTTTNPESGFVTKDTEVALDGVYTYYAVFSSKVASLNFGTPAVSDDFESCTEQTSTTKHNPATTISNCGIFTYCYNNTSNAYGVQSDTYGKYLHVKGNSSPLSLSYQNSSNFSTTGAWSVKINKGATCDFGFYSEGASGTALTNASARVYMRYANGAISVGSGSSMASTGYTYYGDAEVVEITMIYNATNNATTYGDNISLGSGKAHVYVNGEAIMNGDNPKEMTIVKTATKYFRIASQSTTVAKFYDVNIYNALPTTTSIEGCEWATQCCTPWTPTLSYAKTTMQVGEEQDAVVGTYYGTATYTSSNPSSVEVNESTGHIKAVGGGTATISVTWAGDDTYCEQSTTSQEITVNGSLQVSFNGNGADGGTAMDPQAVEYNVATNINKNTYTKTGYTFSGWNTDKDATSILYTDEQSVAFTAGVELFAIWSINAHKVTVKDATGGTIAISPTTATINYGTTVTATATLTPGYNFVSWSATPSVVTFAEATNKSTTFSMPDADITLTASYTPILVTKIDLKKGSDVVTALEFEKNVTDPVTLTTSFTPADALVKTVNWQSDNTEVATVDNGVLTAQGLGTAVVTATSTVVPTVAGSVTVTVYEWQDADPKYTLTNQPASTVYYETNKINFSDWTIKHNLKRSDDAAKTKQEDVASSNWIVTLGGEVIANNYALTTADNGKALVIKVGETTLYNQTLTVNEKAKHTYIDRVHGNETKVMIDTYDIPSLTNTTAKTEGACDETHYVFKGWVAEANADAPSDDNLIAAGGSATAEADATFYAVWAEHKQITKDLTMFYGWETTGNTSGWKSAVTAATTGYHSGSQSGKLSSSNTAIETTNKIEKPKSFTYYARKTSTNDKTGQYIVLQYSSSGSSFSDIDAGKVTNSTLQNDNNNWTKVTVDLSAETYKNQYFRIHKEGNAEQLIDDVTLVYEGDVEEDLDYITECVTRYELTFNTNGGTGTAPATILLKEGGKVALPNATLTKAYNDFNGWNTQADGQGTHYDVAAEYTMGGENTTLYADWAPRAVESLVITSEATTKEFGIGQTFSSEGLKVKATYVSTETENNVAFTTNYDGHVFTADEEGQQTVTISYKGVTTTYNILVAPALIVRFFVNGTQIQEKSVFDKKIGAMPNAMTSNVWKDPENAFIASHYPIFAGWTLATSDDNIEFVNEGTAITTDVNVNAVFAEGYSVTSIATTATDATDLAPENRYVIGVTVDEETRYYKGSIASKWAETSTNLADAEIVTVLGKTAPYAIQQTNEKYFVANSGDFKDLAETAEYSFSITDDKYIKNNKGEYFLSRNTNSGTTNTGLRWYATGENYPKAFLYEANVTYDHLTIAPKGDHVRTGLTYDKAGTICLPYAVKADDYKGASVWSIESRVGSGDMIYAITLVEEVDEGGNKKDLVAGKPYIFFAEESEFQLFYSGDEYTGSTSVWANGLIGNLNAEDIVINAGGYQPGSYLINQNKLMECGADCYVGQYRAYVKAAQIGAGEPLQAPVMAPRRVIGNPNVAPTRIDNLNEDAWVNMNGAHKFFLDGNIVIMNEGKLYNAQGIRVQ